MGTRNKWVLPCQTKGYRSQILRLLDRRLLVDHICWDTWLWPWGRASIQKGSRSLCAVKSPRRPPANTDKCSNGGYHQPSRHSYHCLDGHVQEDMDRLCPCLLEWLLFGIGLCLEHNRNQHTQQCWAHDYTTLDTFETDHCEYLFDIPASLPSWQSVQHSDINFLSAVHKGAHWQDVALQWCPWLIDHIDWVPSDTFCLCMEFNMIANYLLGSGNSLSHNVTRIIFYRHGLPSIAVQDFSQSVHDLSTRKALCKWLNGMPPIEKYDSIAGLQESVLWNSLYSIA